MSSTPSRRHHRAGFLAGLIAGTSLTIAMTLLRQFLNTFSLPELVGFRIIAVIPMETFSLLIETFGSNAKQLLLVGTTIGQVVVAGLLGILWASCTSELPGEGRRERRFPALWNADLPGGLFFALFLFIFVEILVFPAVGAGVLGGQLSAGLGPTSATLAGFAALYGLVLAYVFRKLLAPETAAAEQADQIRLLTRRQVLARAILGAGALAVAAGALFGLTRTPTSAAGARRSGRVGNGDLPPEITPIDDFYSISKNFVDPKVSEDGWKLEIGGMVERPYSLTLAEIRALPAVTDYRTLSCISNEVGGDLISNGGWKGVRMKDLLERAGVKAGAFDVALYARDGYAESFPIAKALDPDVLAVYEMNGETLPDKNGFPLRLLVPDIFGMKNVKWLTRIDVVSTDFKGYWQEQGWSDTATVQTMSRIDFPRHRDLLPTGKNRLGGISFAGARGVAKVEVTTDNGTTWREATLRRPLGPYAWVLWTAEIDLPEGDATVSVRATDGKGTAQSSRRTSTLPDGATGWHTIIVRTAPGVPAPSPAAQVATPPAIGTPAMRGIFTP